MNSLPNFNFFEDDHHQPFGNHNNTRMTTVRTVVFTFLSFLHAQLLTNQHLIRATTAQERSARRPHPIMLKTLSQRQHITTSLDWEIKHTVAFMRPMLDSNIATIFKSELTKSIYAHTLKFPTTGNSYLISRGNWPC